MAEDRDYYEILGIDRNADAEAIKSAYRKLAKKYHPDLHPGDTDAEKHFKEVNEAYSVLSDPDKKAKYDQFGKAAFDPTAGAGGGYSGGFTDFGDLGDIFGSIFGGAFGGGTTSRRTGPQRGCINAPPAAVPARKPALPPKPARTATDPVSASWFSGWAECPSSPRLPAKSAAVPVGTSKRPAPSAGAPGWNAKTAV